MRRDRLSWLVVIVCAALLYSSGELDSVKALAPTKLPNPRLFLLHKNEFPWHVVSIVASRVESNSAATRDAQVLYQAGKSGPSWWVLGRVTGSYQRAVMSRQGMRTIADVLVSEFRSPGEARRAFRVEQTRRSLPAGQACGRLGRPCTYSALRYAVYQNLELDVAVTGPRGPRRLQADFAAAAKALSRRLLNRARSALYVKPSPTMRPTATTPPTSTPEPTDTPEPSQTTTDTPTPGSTSTPTGPSLLSATLTTVPTSALQ